jgi:anti-anti-sigma factor
MTKITPENQLQKNNTNSVFSFSKEIDRTQMSDFESFISTLPTECDNICLDFADVDYINSTVLNFLIIQKKTLQEKNVSLCIKNLQEFPEKVITLTGLESLLCNK